MQYWELLVFGVLFGTFDAVFTPAIMAITPEIVPDDLLPAMNSLRPLSNNLIGNMIGPAVGGVLAAWSTSFAIGVDCATFIVSAGALVLMKPTPAPDRKAGASMIDDVQEGPRYVRDTRRLWTTLLAVTLVNAFVATPMFVLIPYFLLHNFHSSKLVVGYALATF